MVASAQVPRLLFGKIHGARHLPHAGAQWELQKSLDHILGDRRRIFAGVGRQLHKAGGNQARSQIANRPLVQPGIGADDRYSNTYAGGKKRIAVATAGRQCQAGQEDGSRSAIAPDCRRPDRAAAQHPQICAADLQGCDREIFAVPTERQRAGGGARHESFRKAGVVPAPTPPSGPPENAKPVTPEELAAYASYPAGTPLKRIARGIGIPVVRADTIRRIVWRGRHYWRRGTSCQSASSSSSSAAA